MKEENTKVIKTVEEMTKKKIRNIKEETKRTRH